ncbi:uncharacterized protein JCM10292_001850 [Rhodotorula paludigena]|uniref:uncharacterized protein n=1 Tax=Rhodotorula paludigena TaxID=86838 RepID=UPI00317D8308
MASRSVGARIRQVVWGAPPDSKAERKLLFKMDWFILSFICLMYWSNYLDRANLANAYVSGMKEALNMVGNDLNKVNTCFTVGYTIGMLPQNILLQFVPARILFPLNTVIWGGCTMVTAAAKNTAHLCVIRLFQGIAESSTFVGAHYIMGSWYKEAEIGKRAAIFSAAAQIATLFSGVLQSAVHTSMDGLHGLAGFQWLFIVCGVITIPIGFYGYAFFPDTPQRNRSFVFTAEEKALAISRLPEKPKTQFNRTIFKRVLGHWRWWLMSIMWIINGELESIGSNSLMALWMKNRVAAGVASWTTSNFNLYPNGAVAVAVVALLVTAVWTDYTQKRFHVNLVIAVTMVISATLILCQDSISRGGVFLAFYISGISYAGQASCFSWANDITQHDNEERAIVLASMNMWSNAFNSWWSIVFFPADHAPKWERGMISIIVLCPIFVGVTLAARYLQLRDQRRGLVPGKEAAAALGSGSEEEAGRPASLSRSVSEKAAGEGEVLEAK